MRNQEIFDKVVTHLATQRKQARNTKTQYCVYRADDGCMCAIGCLLIEYVPSMEDHNVFSLLRLDSPEPELRKIMLRSGLTAKSEKLLTALQNAHDNSVNWRAPHILFSALKRIAKKKSLKTNTLKSVFAPWLNEWEVANAQY